MVSRHHYNSDTEIRHFSYLSQSLSLRWHYHHRFSTSSVGLSLLQCLGIDQKLPTIDFWFLEAQEHWQESWTQKLIWCMNMIKKMSKNQCGFTELYMNFGINLFLTLQIKKTFLKYRQESPCNLRATLFWVDSDKSMFLVVLVVHVTNCTKIEILTIRTFPTQSFYILVVTNVTHYVFVNFSCSFRIRMISLNNQ